MNQIKQFVSYGIFPNQTPAIIVKGCIDIG